MYENAMYIQRKTVLIVAFESCTNLFRNMYFKIERRQWLVFPPENEDLCIKNEKSCI